MGGSGAAPEWSIQVSGFFASSVPVRLFHQPLQTGSKWNSSFVVESHPGGSGRLELGLHRPQVRLQIVVLLEKLSLAVWKMIG